MSDQNDTANAGGQGASTSSDAAASTVTPPAQQATPGLSLADVQRLMSEERTKLTADFEQKQAAREAILRAEMAALAAGKKVKPPAKVEPAAVETEIPPPAPKLEDDPAYQSLLTAQKDRDAKFAEIEKALKAEQGKREAAEEAAREQERFNTVFETLTDLENPVRTNADGGQMAAKWLLLNKKIRRSQNGQYFFVSTEGGEEKPVALKEGIQGWLASKEGQMFRPPIPSGAGTTSGFLPGAGGQTPKRPLNDDEAITAARDHDRRRRQQMGRSSLN